MANLQGQYHLTNSTLLKEDTQQTHLLIGSRRKPTPTKPKYFLLEKVSQKGGKYISSLYPSPKWAENGLQAYFFDFGGQDYELTLDRPNQRATISQRPPQTQGFHPTSNSTFSINNVELGAKIAPNGQV
jgi:hypothetical protein